MVSFGQVAIFATAAQLILLSRVEGWSSSFSGSRIHNARVSAGASMTMRFPMVEQWRVLKNGAVVGIVQNHPRIDDGDTITTSPLKSPDAAAPKAVVETKSGSKYKLGTPKNFPRAAAINGKQQKKRTTAPAAQPIEAKKAAPPVAKKSVELNEAWRRAKMAYELTGLRVGDYLLAGKVTRSTSGKSKLWKCYKMDEKGLPQGDAFMVKVSPNYEALSREAENYERVTSGFTRGQFVQFVEFFERAGDGRSFSKQSAIVLERGDMDLKAYISSVGPLTGKSLREAAVAAVQCLQAVHSCSLVWTDLKTENFVVKQSKDGNFDVKGIDLESAMPFRDNPVDYSPEACPPEFAEAFLAGEGPYFLLDYSYDVWSLGMFLYEVSTGKSVFEGKNPSQITKLLKAPGYEVDVTAVSDDKLRDLISSCLMAEPKQRLSIPQVLLHPYFLTTGIGPFSF